MSVAYRLLLALSAMAPCAVAAQSTPSTQSPQPADANAAVPAFMYASAFATYRPDATESVSPARLWRQANDDLAKSASHGTHADDDADAPGAAKPVLPNGAKPDPHAGHRARQSGGE